MQILVNGSPQELDAKATVAQLLEKLRLAPIRVAVERNEELVPRGEFAATDLQPGDRLEIVTLVGGG